MTPKTRPTTVCLLLAVSTSLAHPASGIQVPVCQTAPRLDADLGDPCWQKATRISAFTSLATRKPAEVDTVVWLCRDDTWLYVAFRCHEPNPIAIRRTVTDRDAGVHHDDSVEIFIDPGHGGEQYAHLALSVDNVQGDQWCRGRERLRSWDLPWRSAARLDPHLDTAKGWSAEAAIPLALLQRRGGSAPWRINLCRSRRTISPAEHMSLAPLPAGAGFHAPQHFLPIHGLTGFKANVPFGPMIDAVKVLPLTIKDAAYSYGMEISIKNHTSRAGELELVAQDLPRSGRAKQVAQKIALGPSQVKKAALRIEVAGAGPRDAWVGLREPGSDRWLQKIPVAGMDGLSPFEAYLDRNYYTTESQARVYAEIAIARSERVTEGLGLMAELTGAKAGTPASCVEDVVSVDLDLTDVPVGSHAVRARLLNRAKEQLGSVELRLTKRRPAPEGTQEVKIDRYNRCLLLNREPFFPVGGVGTYYHGRFEGWRVDYFDAQYRHCREAGLNVILDWVGYFPPRAGLEAARRTYDLAHKHGLKIIGRPYGSDRGLRYSNPQFREVAAKTIAAMDPYLKMCSHHPAVIGYYHFDEPQPRLKIDDVLETFTRKVHDVDPYHPVYMSLTRYIHETQRRWFGTVTDLLGAHNYWYVMRPRGLRAMAGYWHMLDAFSREAHSPTMALPQLDYWGLGYRTGGFMLPDEQRAQTYLALVHGARSVIYFVLPFRHQASVATQKQLSAEIRELAPALLAREPAQEVTFEPQAACTRFPLGNVGVRGQTRDLSFPLVQVSLRSHPSVGHVLLAVNPGKEAADVRFTISSLTPQSAAQRLFADKQQFPIEDGAFSDTLEPMGTRSYLLERTRTSIGKPVRIHLTMSGPAVDAADQPIPTLKHEPEPTKNLVSNSSFERQRMPGHPVHWEAKAWTWLIPDRRTNGLETTNPFHGKHCFRVTRVYPDETRALHEPVILRNDGPHTLSLYLRSDKPGTRAMLYLKPPYKTVKLGVEWQRYTMTREVTRKGRTYVGVYHVGKTGSANIYVDAVQLEEGSEATEYEPN